MTYGELYEEFLASTKISESAIEDYRPCAPPYNGIYIENAIIVWLNNGGQIIYIGAKKEKGA